VGPANSQREIAFGHMAGQLDAVALIGLGIEAKRMDAGQDWEGLGCIIQKKSGNKPK